MHKAQKVVAGHYVYREHNIYREDDYSGPEGGERVHWSVSGQIGSPDENFAHAELPQLATLAGAKKWVDAHLDGNHAEKQRVLKFYQPDWY